MKGTASHGRKSGKKTHIRCRRCGRTSYHKRKKRCASCGFGAIAQKRSYKSHTNVKKKYSNSATRKH
ncbi:50S ribosomal protein L37e [Candidatus Woesearchaeota archaeon]|nr:50S ribosomal protein L37e [Candidatus Woesearchaeota archaeon]